MSDKHTNEPLLEMFLFETSQLIEQFEQYILMSEESSCFTQSAINEIFRIMHTIKGSSAMMGYHNISTLAHSVEDLFYYIRETKPANLECSSISDLILEAIDFIKIEVNKIEYNKTADGDGAKLIETMKNYLTTLKLKNTTSDNYNEMDKSIDMNKSKNTYISHNISETDNANNIYKATIFFEDGCEMENVRAFTIIHNLKQITQELFYIPEDIIETDTSIDIIRREGFQVYLKSKESYQTIYEFFMKTIFLKDLELIQLENEDEYNLYFMEVIKNETKLDESKGEMIEECKEDYLEEKIAYNQVKVKEDNKEHNNEEIRAKDMEDNKADDTEECKKVENEKGLNKSSGTYIINEDKKEPTNREIQTTTSQQSIISVSVNKLDKLMDLVGEMVVAEAMLIQNPDLEGLELDNFKKAAGQLNKITNELQDIVMSIRMVPLTATFNKMHRIVRDMNKKLKKEVKLEIIGEETEVDKNIIEHISDPLMHLVRNSIDHGIEETEVREIKGKPKMGTVTLEAKNDGNEVLIIVKDDGIGLNKEKILNKARNNGLILKDEKDMSDKEIYNLILLPGFSTNESVTEFSGRGVGMDVVAKNIETIGGSLHVESVKEKGTIITLKIPLTLAIIDGMNIRIGSSLFTIPITSIKESFKPLQRDIIKDTEGNEMIMVRGQCYPIIRLHQVYHINTVVTNFTDGIIIMVEQDDKTSCIFADELLGQQQVVVKALPAYIKRFKTINGLAGCTLLGNGSISLILDIASLISV